MGKLVSVSPRIYYMPFEEDTDRPNLGYILGDRFSAAIDAGNSQKHVEKFYAAIQEAGLPLPSITALTHWHWDHTFGLCAINGLSIACRATQKQLEAVRRWEWTNAAMARRIETGEDIEFCDEHIRKEYPDLKQIRVIGADIAFESELEVDLGGVSLLLRHVAAPHSSDSVIACVPGEGVVFAGDADGGDFYGNGGKSEPNSLAAYIKTLEALEFGIYVPGHDAPMCRGEAIRCLYEDMRSATGHGAG